MIAWFSAITVFFFAIISLSLNSFVFDPGRNIPGCKLGERAEYIWIPGVMGHSAMMRCGNGRETTCHCRERLQSRGKALSQPSTCVHLCSLFICLFISFSSFSSSSPLLSLSLSFRNCISCFCVVGLSQTQLFQTLTHLWDNVTCRPRQHCGCSFSLSFPFCNIKSRLNHWQPWKLMFCL